MIGELFLVVLSSALLFRWGLRTTRLRRRHGAPPGVTRWILAGVTAGTIGFGVWLTWFFSSGLVEDDGARLVLAVVAGSASYLGGAAAERSITSWSERRKGRAG